MTRRMTFIDLAHGDELRIGPDIVVTVSRLVDGYKAVLGIEAPRSITVDRAEVRQVVERQGRVKGDGSKGGDGRCPNQAG